VDDIVYDNVSENELGMNTDVCYLPNCIALIYLLRVLNVV